LAARSGAKTKGFRTECQKDLEEHVEENGQKEHRGKSTRECGERRAESESSEAIGKRCEKERNLPSRRRTAGDIKIWAGS
jgi:hypothetical protein